VDADAKGDIGILTDKLKVHNAGTDQQAAPTNDEVSALVRAIALDLLTRKSLNQI